MLNVIWFVAPALQLVAERRKLLSKAGVAINEAQTNSSDEQFEALDDGRQDAAITSMDNVIMWNRRSRAGNFRIVAQIEATTAISLVAGPGFKTLSSLRGKRLLVDSAENGFVIALRALLADSGVEFSDCSILPTGGVKERFAELLHGGGDATLLGPPFVEKAMQAGMCRLADLDTVYPSFPGQGVVIRQDLAPERLAELVRWLGVLEWARLACRRDAPSAADEIAAFGIPAEAAGGLVGAVADSLTVSRAGVELLIAQRAQLRLPGADECYDQIVDSAPLEDALKLANT